MKSKEVRYAIFASGSGTNARELIHYFKTHSTYGTVALIVCNRPKAGVLDVAHQQQVPAVVINKAQLLDESYLLATLSQYQVNGIVLAGFLLKIPPFLVEAFPERIVNIHPALLPKYGGKGMYGHYVHQAVINNRERESGITIHLVNNQYDEGPVLFQEKCPVVAGDTPETLAKKIQALEWQHFGPVVARYFEKLGK
jgi:phosphoribosylglycinamide formyltransferase-1